MEQERILYHGSIIGGLDTILANARSHTDGGSVAYFTTDRVYALVCCRSREENFVTMGPKDGVRHYFERFPYRLKTPQKTAPAEPLLCCEPAHQY